MPVPHSRHVALAEPLVRFVDAPMTKGRCVAASAVMRAALRLLMEQEDARAGTVEATRQESPIHG